MPPSCCATDYDALFDEGTARRELAAYRRKGPGRSTARLLDAIRAEGVVGASVLDIGAGVGIIGTELLAAGASHLTGVDFSRPYLAAARSEVTRRGWEDRARFVHGDFVAVAEEVEAADIVTLDRVVCCYVDWASLVATSVERARRLYGLIYPRDRWAVRAVIGLSNVLGRLFGRDYPFRVHPDRQVDARIRAAGFEPVFHHRGIAWQTVLYRRVAATT